jgi:biopolymer transport protein ExbB
MLSQKFFALAGGLDLVVLYLLLLLSITSIALIIERFLTLKKISQASQESQVLLRKALETSNFGLVKELKGSTSLEARTISVILEYYKKRSDQGLDELFNSHVLSIKPQLERYLNFLATIGSNAPYIGLLGTVLGIMKAFHDLASQTEAGIQSVMSGISGALLATAAGLFVAIPAVMAYNYYQRKVRSILSNIEMAKDLALVYCKTQGES